jgi:hypothetical protein
MRALCILGIAFAATAYVYSGSLKVLYSQLQQLMVLQCF